MRRQSKLFVLSALVLLALFFDSWQEARLREEFRAVARLWVGGTHLPASLSRDKVSRTIAETILESASLAERARRRAAALRPEIKMTPVHILVEREDPIFGILAVTSVGRTGEYTREFLDCLLDEFRDVEMERRTEADAPVYADLNRRQKRITELQVDLREWISAKALSVEATQNWQLILVKEQEELDLAGGRQSIREEAESVTILDRPRLEEPKKTRRYGLVFAILAGFGMAATIVNSIREHRQIQGDVP